MNQKLALVYKALKNGGWNPSGTGQKGAFRAICPCCGERFAGNNSKLSVAEGDRVPVLIKCFAGCGAIEVIKALGLDTSALFSSTTPTTFRGPQRWIDPAAALAGVADEAFTVAVLAALVADGEELTEKQRDELADARRNIESTLKLVKRG